ncbi:MAG: hypothetical protein U9Q03_04710 [Patescibacteria group bacterium]|nr:hypothetical protein [Patescibacteria group bacterium]
MDQQFEAKLSELTEKIDATYRSVEKMRKFFMWTLIITAVMFILPLIGIVILIPVYLNTLGGLVTI